jgi:nucleoside-diphosphate-sugar epimerase
MGLEAVHRFHQYGFTVTVFNRGSQPDTIYPTGTQVIHGDRNHRSALQQLLGRTFDVVLDTSAYTPEQTAMAIEAFTGCVGRYIHMSSGAVYQSTEVFPIPEEHPLGEWPVWGEYGRNKRRCEELLLEAYAIHRFPVVIVRAPYVLGPRNYAPRETFVWDRVRRGEPVLLPDGGRALIQFIFVDEMATVFYCLATLEGRDPSGQAFNVGGDEYWTLRGFVEAAAALTGQEPVLAEVWDYVRYPYDMAGFFPFPNENYLLRTVKIREWTGLTFRPLVEGLKGVYAWYMSAQ